MKKLCAMLTRLKVRKSRFLLNAFQSNQVENAPRLMFRLFLKGHTIFTEEFTHHNVSEDCHIAKGPHHLEGPNNAPAADLIGLFPGDIFSLESKGSLIGGIEAANNAEKGRFPGTVGPN